MEPLSKVLAVFLTIVAMFIAPIIIQAQLQDNTLQSTVYAMTDDFVEQIRAQGKITQDMYLEFIQRLDATDLLYDVKITHSHSTVVPVYDSTGATIATKTVDNITYTQDILASVYETEGVYLMNKGDMISVSVTNREPTLGQRLREMLFFISDSAAINVRDGGVIRDENY